MSPSRTSPNLGAPRRIVQTLCVSPKYRLSVLFSHAFANRALFPPSSFAERLELGWYCQEEFPSMSRVLMEVWHWIGHGFGGTFPDRKISLLEGTWYLFRYPDFFKPLWRLASKRSARRNTGHCCVKLVLCKKANKLMIEILINCFTRWRT